MRRQLRISPPGLKAESDLVRLSPLRPPAQFLKARNSKLRQAGNDEAAAARIEAAYDSIMMRSLSLRSKVPLRPAQLALTGHPSLRAQPLWDLGAACAHDPPLTPRPKLTPQQPPSLAPAGPSRRRAQRFEGAPVRRQPAPHPLGSRPRQQPAEGRPDQPRHRRAPRPPPEESSHCTAATSARLLLPARPGPDALPCAFACPQAVLLAWTLLSPFPRLQPMTMGMLPFFFRTNVKVRSGGGRRPPPPRRSRPPNVCVEAPAPPALTVRERPSPSSRSSSRAPPTRRRRRRPTSSGSSAPSARDPSPAASRFFILKSAPAPLRAPP